jgi:hypothetical protein
VDEDHAGVEPQQRPRGGDGHLIGDAAVVGLAHPGGGDAEAEEAGVEACELAFDRAVVEQIGMDDLAQLGMALPGRTAADGDDSSTRDRGGIRAARLARPCRSRRKSGLSCGRDLPDCSLTGQAPPDCRSERPVSFRDLPEPSRDGRIIGLDRRFLPRRRALISRKPFGP